MAYSERILLHTCCAPCASSCLERLQLQEREVTLFFSNSNLDTLEEFNRRLNEVVKLSKIFLAPLIVDEYDHDAWLAAIAGLEKEPETGKRCNLCFAFSFGRAADKAAELEMPFTTSLSVSPYKSLDALTNEGILFDNFEFYNFKKQNGFVRSLELSRQYSLYRQCYCGCEFSHAESRARYQ